MGGPPSVVLGVGNSKHTPSKEVLIPNSRTGMRASKGPFATDKLAVPLQHRLRLEQEDNLAELRARLAVDRHEPRGQDC